MTFEQENALRIKNFIETNRTLSITNLTYRIRWFDGKTKDLQVTRIPIELLTYNFDNMRIEGELIEETNKKGRPLDFENLDDREVYAGIFKQSLQIGADRIKSAKLKKSIGNTHQETPGIITDGGVILDGNRRFMVLEQLYTQELSKKTGNPDRFRYMDVVRLEPGISKSQLIAIQTYNQLFEEFKVNYTLINQALAVRKLKTYGYDHNDVAKMFNFQVSNVQEFEVVLDLIDLFLEDNGLEEKYTEIDKRNLFDHFRELRKLLVGHSKYTGLRVSALEEEQDLMRDVAYKWLKNNLDPQMVEEKKIMKSREVIRRLREIVHNPELKAIAEKVLTFGDDLKDKREVHKLMDGAVTMAREAKKEESIYIYAEQITTKLDIIQKIIDGEEPGIDIDKLKEIMEENRSKHKRIIESLDLHED